MGDQEYGAIYNEYNNSRLGKRVTDLNQKTMKYCQSLIVGSPFWTPGVDRFLLSKLQARCPDLAFMELMSLSKLKT